MRKPLIKALLAELYIITVVLLIQYGITSEDAPESIFMPIMMLSLFVLSVTVMGYLFFAEPIRFYLENKKKEAVGFFLKTVAAFATITVLMILVWILFFAQ